MRMNLTIKFFLAFLFTSITIVVLMVAVMQFYAYRNFSDFVGKVELTRLGELAMLLGEEYQKDHGWEPLKKSPGRWGEVLRLHRFPPDMFKEPPGPPGPGLHPPPPPPLPPLPPPDEHGDAGPPGRYRQPPPFWIEDRVTLFDAQKHPVAGVASSADGLILRRVVAGGKTVGWLGLKQKGFLSDPLNTAFIRQQFQSLYAVGAIMLVLAAVVAYLLSRHLLAPVRQLITGTRALTSRKFDTRIVVETSDELGQLAADFNQMARTLEKYEELRQQWISDIAHELRTPLSILQGEIEALQDGVRKVTHETLGSLHAEVVHIGTIVKVLHDLSLAESAAFQCGQEPVHLIQTVRTCLQKFQGLFDEKNISLTDWLGEVDDVSIMGDRERLTQVFSNLLENTLRYTDTPGDLTVSLVRTDTEVVLQFADTKPGVPPESLARLFDRLYRVDASRGRAQGGAGLGLAICKTIVEAHGGTITAQQSPAEGLQINITFPIRRLQ